ncbi:phospholipid scramblase 2-like [Panonychus citri]|uniref:phospholipid scramblase 2-like n=1 Tax=Panonychus citri TaxID=50023 RepID=UPI002307EDBB|nr:phospholipid scramblase 2-like [Panonychus citri]
MSTTQSPEQQNQQQPLEENWMATPSVPNCPPGLEYLTQVDQLLVHQHFKKFTSFSRCHIENRFDIKNASGQKIYIADEQITCKGMWCGPSRSFEMQITDQHEREILHLSRPFRCQCFPCCLQQLEVSASGSVCGFVKESWSLFVPKFRICNAAGETVLRIEGPFCTFGCGRDIEFKIFTSNGNTQIGRIAKKWIGLTREVLSDIDHFGISFPMDLDVNIKAVLLGACFLIDFMYFEGNGSRIGASLALCCL